MKNAIHKVINLIIEIKMGRVHLHNGYPPHLYMYIWFNAMPPNSELTSHKFLSFPVCCFSYRYIFFEIEYYYTVADSGISLGAGVCVGGGGLGPHSHHLDPLLT